MKKLILCFVSVCVVFLLPAQTKITKSSIVGKWVITSMEMPGMMYYNIEKDSLAVSETLKSQIKDEKQMAALTAGLKPMTAVFAKMYFQFNENGTAEIGTGISEPQSVVYSVDEANSVITTTQKDQPQEVIKAGMLGDKLRITQSSPQGEVIIVLKKAKA